MRKFLTFLIALAITISVSASAFAQSIIGSGIWGDAKPSGGGGYTGPGDILAATYWWGLRCYSNAYSGNVAQIVDAATGTTTGTLLACSSGTVSAVVSSSACTFVTGNACSPLATTCSTACAVEQLYEQVAGGAPMILRSGFNAGKDVPVYTQNCIGTKPCMTLTASADGGNGQGLYTGIGGTISVATPVGYSVVGSRTANFTTGQVLVSAVGSSQTQITYTSSANTIDVYGGGAFTATASDSSFHALNVTYNGASSSVRVDSTNTTGNGGTGALTATDAVIALNVSGASFHVGLAATDGF
jgi:hypothetical protein